VFGEKLVFSKVKKKSDNNTSSVRDYKMMQRESVLAGLVGMRFYYLISLKT